MTSVSRWVRGATCALLFASLLFAGSNYSFTNIDYRPWTWAYPYGFNDSGDVLMYSELPPDEGLILLALDNGPIVTIARRRSFLYGTSRPVMNNHRDIAFRAWLTPGGKTSVYLMRRGDPKTLAPISEDIEVSGDPFINDKGDVYFTGMLQAGGITEWAIFRADGKSVEKIASTGTTEHSLYGVNNKGTALLVKWFDWNMQDLVTLDRGRFTVIAKIRPGEERISFYGSMATNDHAEVAFVALLSDGRMALCKVSDGQFTTIAPGGAYPYGSQLLRPSINDKGVVVFFVNSGWTGLEERIQIGPDPLQDLVNSGDPLFGSTIERVSSTPSSLNNRGQILFHYTLATGKQGIAVATPIH